MVYCIIIIVIFFELESALLVFYYHRAFVFFFRLYLSECILFSIQCHIRQSQCCQHDVIYQYGVSDSSSHPAGLSAIKFTYGAYYHRRRILSFSQCNGDTFYLLKIEDL